MANEFYRVDTGAGHFFAVVDTETLDVAENRSGQWRSNSPLLADIMMPEQKHMDWGVREIGEGDVPPGWENVLNQTNSAPPSASQASP